jgi:hypothetical protein
MKIWGYHYSVDGVGNENVKDGEKIKAFGDDMIKSIDMEAYGECQLVHFGKDNKQGWTWSQLITTSNSCLHACDDTLEVYFDVFSCKPIDVEVVKAKLKEYFELEIHYERFYKRGVFETSSCNDVEKDN